MEDNRMVMKDIILVVAVILAVGAVWYATRSDQIEPTSLPSDTSPGELTLTEPESITISAKGGPALQLMVPGNWLPLEQPKTEDNSYRIIRGKFAGCYRFSDDEYLFGFPNVERATVCPTVQAWVTKDWAAQDELQEGPWYSQWTAGQKQADLGILETIYRQQGLAGIDVRQDVISGVNERSLVGPIWGNGPANTDRFLPKYISTQDTALRGIAFTQNELQDYGVIPVYRVLLYHPESTLLVDILMPVDAYEPFFSDRQIMDAKLEKALGAIQAALERGEDVDSNREYENVVKEHYRILYEVDAEHDSDAGRVMQAVDNMAKSIRIAP